MPLSVPGVVTAASIAGEVIVPMTAVMRELYINDAPLFSRLDHVPVSAAEYKLITNDVRQRPFKLTLAVTAVAANTVATITLEDTTQLMQGDILELKNTAGSAFERMEVMADPATATTVSVMRGVEGTTPVANDVSAPTTQIGMLIGNSRTGHETEQKASRTVRNFMTQYVQTYQFPVQVGGLAQAITAIQLPAGMGSLWTMESATKMTEMVRDIEFSSLYGVGQSATVANQTARRKQVGLRQQIINYNGGSNYLASAGGSFTKLNFITNSTAKILAAGGDPDIIICGPDAEVAFATWSLGMVSFQGPDRTEYLGTKINGWQTTFGSKPLRIIPHAQMPKGTYYIGTSRDLRMRVIRDPLFQKRGYRGDLHEGEYIGDLCIEAQHPGWHSWIEGATGYSAA